MMSLDWRRAEERWAIKSMLVQEGVSPLSKLTVALLEDLDYIVDPNKVDPFTLPTGDVAAFKYGEAVLHLSDDAIDTTIGVVDENGDVIYEAPGILIETHLDFHS